jgi:hypothetical protein
VVGKAKALWGTEIENREFIKRNDAFGKRESRWKTVTGERLL